MKDTFSQLLTCPQKIYFTVFSDKAGYPIKKKTPAIRCKEITYRLCRALKESLQVTPSLKCLEIQGLPLRERDLSGLSKV